MALPAFVSAQEQAPREIPVDDLMQMHRSNVNKFKALVERFTAAVEEKEQQSVTVLQKELLDQMTSQVSYNLNMSKQDAANPNWKDRYEKQNGIYKKLEQAKLQIRTNAGMNAALDIVKDLNTFASTMEVGLADIEAYLRNN
ncbi:MAG: hypothetical protein D6816_06470 [Bacteroidetes bacterium]|nr:MAG: hypothetical protein D6816_06470 [Bacteroidota bacterium]